LARHPKKSYQFTRNAGYEFQVTPIKWKTFTTEEQEAMVLYWLYGPTKPNMTEINGMTGQGEVAINRCMVYAKRNQLAFIGLLKLAYPEGKDASLLTGYRKNNEERRTKEKLPDMAKSWKKTHPTWR